MGKTEVASSASPLFNTHFTFDVEVDATGPTNLELMLELRSRRPFSSEHVDQPASIVPDEDDDAYDPTLGIAVVDVNMYRKQQKQSIDLPVTGLLTNGTQATGAITISLLWLHDLPLLLQQHRDFLQRSASGTVAEKDTNPLHGITFSRLVVEVKQAQQVVWPTAIPPRAELRAAFVRLHVQDSMAETEQIPVGEALGWGMNFTFDIEQTETFSEDCLHLSLHCTFAQPGVVESQEECLGSLMLPLASLSDQRRKVGWFSLQPAGASTSTSAGQVQLSMLWLHDLSALSQ
jgi:hypothetical protein